ncbi:hypothetical protein FA15DRAFT_689229 [Coprinopsis marcescibilis]|uniref:Uncharacterized protein n=1 Tax=Coprinopsis marcescibilis TaxID=230819 RepID=A0A5C3KK21_COPMA|nr:hypothetical protein FA15DRAFT_689229 [Coprinopsis marcescibilis]
MSTLDEDDTDGLYAPPRRPKADYHKRNGFAPAFGDDTVTPKKMTEALDTHERALNALVWKARPIPSFEEMEAEVEQVDTTETIQAQIDELKRRHVEELELLYDYHAKEYVQEVIDLARSKDDTQYLEAGVRDPRLAASYSRMDEVFNYTQNLDPHLLPLSTEYSTMRHSYLSRLTELQALLKKTEKEQSSMFPTSIADFHRKPQDLQLRVAKFLTADSRIKQDRMATENGWAWRQIEPLKAELDKNAEFRALLSAMVVGDQFKF